MIKRLNRTVVSSAALALVAFSLALHLQAQTQGEITGTVNDSTGAVIVGAKVTATNPATNATRNATSNDAGVYSFPAMLPGMYSLKVETAGFKTAHIADIQLQVQQTARIDVTLEVGEVTQTV